MPEFDLSPLKRRPCEDCGYIMKFAWPAKQADPRMDRLADVFQQCHNKDCQMYMAVVDVRTGASYNVTNMRFDAFLARFYPNWRG